MSISSVNSSSKRGQEPVFKTAPTNPRVEDIAEPLRPGGENSYLEAYPKDVAFRIKARENFLLPPYKTDFRNLVTLIVSPNMPLEEADLLLHDIAAMTPEQRKKIYALLRGPLSSVINQDNYHDLLQILLTNSNLTDEAEQSFVKAALQLLQPKTPKALKIAIIKALFILCEKHPDRIHLADQLAKQAIEPCFIAPILEMMLQSNWPKQIDLPQFLKRLNELSSVINPKEFNDSSAESILRTIVAMSKLEPEKRGAILAFAKKRPVSCETLKNVIQLFTCRDYEHLSILDQMMPPEMEDRFANALIVTLHNSLGSWEELDKIFPPATREKFRAAIHALLAQQPDIGTITFKEILDGLLFCNDPEAKIQSRLFSPQKEQEAIPNMPPHPLGEKSSAAKAAVCPFQRMWTLPTVSQDPLAMQEILKWHRFQEGAFKVPRFGSLDEKTILRCRPENTPRFREIFFDLLLKGKSQKRLMLIIQDHFDLLFSQGIPQNSKKLEECLRTIASCILDEIPLDWSFLPPILDQKKLFESQLYTDLLNAGYTHEEIVGNLQGLAQVTFENGGAFLSALLNHLQTGGPEVQDLLIQIKQNVQKEIDNGCDIWEAVKNVKEIDMIILEALRMNKLPTIPRQAQTGESIRLDPNLLAGRSDLVGEKPEEFHPTRLSGETEQPISSYWPSAVPWMPFGHGKHLCPGWRLYQVMSRYLLVKAALATP